MVSPTSLRTPGMAVSSVGTLALFSFCGGEREREDPRLFFSLWTFRRAQTEALFPGFSHLLRRPPVEFAAAVQQASPQLSVLALFSQTSTA